MVRCTWYDINDYVIKFVSDLPQVGGFLSLGTQVFSTNKTDRHDITEILLKVALNTINPVQSNLITERTTTEADDNRIRVMVFEATCNNISIISWRWVLLVEETKSISEQLFDENKKLYFSRVTVQLSPSYKATPTASEKWPYKRGGLSWGGSSNWRSMQIMKYLTVFDSKYKYKFQYSYYQAIFSVPLLLILDSISLFETTKVENLFFDEQFKFFWNIPNLCYHYHFCLKERERER